jgi:hypothetical protein
MNRKKPVFAHYVIDTRIFYLRFLSQTASYDVDMHALPATSSTRS